MTSLQFWEERYSVASTRPLNFDQYHASFISKFSKFSLSPKCLKVGVLRCELSYRRCTVSVAEMMDMVETEVEEVEMIEKEVSKGVISVEDIENR